MDVKQIYTLVNDVTKEVLGQTDVVVNEDLSNIVDIGKTIESARQLENYTRTLVDHIGRMVFVNRRYQGRAPRVLMDGWEFGAILQKVRADLPEATENESWELQNGASYDPNIFTQPKVSNKFFNSKTTFEVPMSFTELQVKSAFNSAEQLNAFISMIYTAIENSLTVKTDALIMRTVDNMIAETVYSEYQAGSLGEKSGVRAVNLLKLYNDAQDAELTAEKAITDPAFIRFASYTIGKYSDRLGVMSTLFNVGGTAKFTPAERKHLILLSDFARAADAYLQSDTFHDEFTALPNADVVTYWQGSGKQFLFGDVSKISIKTASGNDVTVTGVIGAMFDRDALGVTNYNRRVTSNYNGKAEFYNEWHKQDASYFNDLDENFVVFFVA